jgi:hypothetical protein
MLTANRPVFPSKPSLEIAMDNQTIFQRMRTLLGARFSFRGDVYTLIEILADEACVVLRGNGREEPIQLDQFGRPLRRAGALEIVPVFAADGEALSEDMLELLASRVSNG